MVWTSLPQTLDVGKRKLIRYLRSAHKRRDVPAVSDRNLDVVLGPSFGLELHNFEFGLGHGNPNRVSDEEQTKFNATEAHPFVVIFRAVALEDGLLGVRGLLTRQMGLNELCNSSHRRGFSFEL